jgi:hypothetical protein
MDITPQDTTQQPISDDQELAKALAGVLPEETAALQPTSSEIPELQFEETPAPNPIPTPLPASDPINTDLVVEEPQEQTVSQDLPTFTQPSNDLDEIKKTALDELRPLMDKVNLPADEKFNTYLMLLRSTDDPSLIEPAHVAAQAITDEGVRAQALLDIIKEIDYLSQDKTS